LYHNIKGKPKNEIKDIKIILKNSIMKNPMKYRDLSEKAIFEPFEKLRFGVLQEKYTLYLLNNEKNNEQIKLNLEFWFYLLLVSSFLLAILYFLK
jgi:hypothetical protein